MKHETSQSTDIQRPQPLPFIKLLSLATVAGGVLYHGWLDMLDASWLMWFVLGLLLLLEAGAADSRPVDWGHVTATLGRILGPAMLPFYGALCLLLAVGPSYVRQKPLLTLPTNVNAPLNRLNEPPAFTPNASSAPKPGSLNAPAVSSTRPPTFKRPNIQQPTPTAAKPQPASTSAPAAPTIFNKPAPIQPSGSARPAPAASK